MQLSGAKPPLNAKGHKMNANIQTFNFNQNEMRTIVKDGNPWFVASDIAKQLDYNKTQNLTDILDDDEKGNANIVTPSSNQFGHVGTQETNMAIINESGLYHAIFKSRKPEAKAFRKWVTSEVLPSIRKNGEYKIPKQETKTEVKIYNGGGNYYVDSKMFQRIEEKRIKKGLTIAKMCQMAGLHQSTYNNIKQCLQMTIKEAKLYKIANALDCPVEWIVRGENKNGKKNFDVIEMPDFDQSAMPTQLQLLPPSNQNKLSYDLFDYKTRAFVASVNPISFNLDAGSNYYTYQYISYDESQNRLFKKLNQGDYLIVRETNKFEREGLHLVKIKMGNSSFVQLFSIEFDLSTGKTLALKNNDSGVSFDYDESKLEIVGAVESKLSAYI